jgi:hypothetical protein
MYDEYVHFVDKGQSFAEMTNCLEKCGLPHPWERTVEK